MNIRDMTAAAAVAAEIGKQVYDFVDEVPAAGLGQVGMCTLRNSAHKQASR